MTAAHLRPVLRSHAALVDQALEVLFPELDKPMSLDGLRALTDDDVDLADVLISVLETGQVTRRMEAYLNARGIVVVERAEADVWDSAIPRLAGADIPVPDPDDFRSFTKVGFFALRASAFRCRIEVDGRTEGSGAFVSKSLVLTAAHVIEKFTDAETKAKATGAEDAVLPKITVRASDGRTYRARCVWHSPVHDQEKQGALPPAAEADAHKDIALLRVGLPLGLSYGYCSLPQEAVSWTGPRMMTLVHYPDGEVRGLTKGRVLREAESDIRLRHDIDTKGGSSGGLAFDHDLNFIGIHQGRWDDFRKLVPHDIFADQPEFLEAIKRDQPRRYLWSLTDDIEGHLIIGRRKFFEGLSYMMENPDGRMRGLWVRRLDRTVTKGLSFSFTMLEAFLQNRTRPSDPKTTHRCFNIATSLAAQDLIEAVASQVLGQQAPAAHAGVREGETSRDANKNESAKRLAEALQARAEGAGETFWLFFEPPPDAELSGATIGQFEELVKWLVVHANLRLILAGFEPHGLSLLRFQNVEDAETARLPGLLVDPLDRFTDADVQVTLTAMLEDLVSEEEFTPAEIDRMRRKVVKGIAGAEAGIYEFDVMNEVMNKIRNRVLTEAGLA